MVFKNCATPYSEKAGRGGTVSLSEIKQAFVKGSVKVRVLF